MFFIDGHCDTITTAMRKGENLLKNTCHIDIDRLKNFSSPVQVFSIWLEKEKLSSPFYNTTRAIDFFKNEIIKNDKYITLIRNYYELIQNIKTEKISGILGIEGCEAFEGNIDYIYKLFNEGVRIFTITWNYENELGFGAATNSKNGLKPFGKNVVKILNNIGGIIDVSHINEKGFWDICEISDKSFIASHSNAQKICPHIRNLSDEQIKEISRRKGIIGINLYPYFLESNGYTDIESILRHTEYILGLGGEEVLGIGSDFDGIDKLPSEIKDISNIDVLYKNFEKYFGKNITEKIMGKNFLTFFEKNL